MSNSVFKTDQEKIDFIESLLGPTSETVRHDVSEVSILPFIERGVGSGWKDLYNECIRNSNTVVQVLLDDSGSMLNRLSNKSLELFKNIVGVNGKSINTRFDLVLFYTSVLLRIMQANGGSVKISFLNTMQSIVVKGATDEEFTKAYIQLKGVSGLYLNGGTPLVERLQEIMREREKDKKFVLLMAIDGVPSDGTPEKIGQLLKSGGDNFYTNFFMATDDEDVVKAYDTIDNTVPRVDTNSIAPVERKQIMDTAFNLGIVVDNNRVTVEFLVYKWLIGSLSSKIDGMDE